MMPSPGTSSRTYIWWFQASSSTILCPTEFVASFLFPQRFYPGLVTSPLQNPPSLLINQSINQSVSQSVSQSTNQPPNQSINKSIKHINFLKWVNCYGHKSKRSERIKLQTPKAKLR